MANCSPENDDYDPRKPQYVMAVSPEEAEAGNAQLLQKQIAKLESAMARRKATLQPQVSQHYEEALDEMKSRAQPDRRKFTHSRVRSAPAWISDPVAFGPRARSERPTEVDESAEQHEPVASALSRETSQGDLRHTLSGGSSKQSEVGAEVSKFASASSSTNDFCRLASCASAEIPLDEIEARVNYVPGQSQGPRPGRYLETAGSEKPIAPRERPGGFNHQRVQSERSSASRYHVNPRDWEQLPVWPLDASQQPRDPMQLPPL